MRAVGVLSSLWLPRKMLFLCPPIFDLERVFGLRFKLRFSFLPACSGMQVFWFLAHAEPLPSARWTGPSCSGAERGEAVPRHSRGVGRWVADPGVGMDAQRASSPSPGHGACLQHSSRGEEPLLQEVEPLSAQLMCQQQHQSSTTAASCPHTS